VLRVEVFGKGKRVVGLEPAVLGVASFITAANLGHGESPCVIAKLRYAKVIKKRKIFT
jgi:hypothetical protein